MEVSSHLVWSRLTLVWRTDSFPGAIFIENIEEKKHFKNWKILKTTVKNTEIYVKNIYNTRKLLLKEVHAKF